MNKKQIKRNVILGILFFLPVVFLLFLYPAKHNYIALDILEENVSDITGFTSDDTKTIQLKDHITILGFIGTNPQDKYIAMSNLKELMYDKFKGFKRFQIVMVLPHSAKAEAEVLKKELSKYEYLEYWKYVYGTENEIKHLYNSLNLIKDLDENLATNDVVIIDKELNLRGRIDDRTDNEKQSNKPVYQLKSYDCIKVAELKNKMSEDLRIIFTEYRQKRKGNFNSETRRANELLNKPE
ncbi:hypothetical protein [Oceanihabitans sediminis]|uniref:Membrane or secreted protein n=1 Tax=Oceanihabitans sediminis TaxID=1812012 RepID=A0A368P8B4_9FLAO|nr:hypothetical protein [Oceanihabitans sediminis]MDX1278714.1 hypothetical protein [Oceanihabitans sediminis]MDX1772690.1 hypothetical protein [Oceanihabitans sediminis]RBP34361.1 hypothetical protein DFR65_101251 [Oceanihabitans sediminis]RCU58039.1 hypothetical protein DU428_01240 [Oceanihabitans sediminis]